MPADAYPSPIFPVINDDLLLSDAIEFNMQNNPDQPFFIFNDVQDGPQVITHLEFGRAAHRAAHALRPVSDATRRDGEVVGILAHTDTILYQTIIAGLMLAGLVAFPISPRNTPSAVVELLKKTSCHHLIVTNTLLHDLIEDTKIQLSALSYDIHISEIPTFDTVYPQLGHEIAKHPFERYPAPQRPSATDTCLIIHSSGSTGPPKPIAQTHLYWSQALVSPEFKDYTPRLVIGCMVLPPFHAIAVCMQLYQPAYSLIAVSLYPPMSMSGGAPMMPSPQNVLEHSKSTKSNSIFVIPAFIQAWASNAETIDYLKELEFLAYAGGPLLPKIGNQLANAGVRLNGIYGSTEMATPCHIVPLKGNTKDWEYLRFYSHAKPRFVPQGDDTFELQLLTCKTHRPMINNLPDVQGYATSDLFKPHPTKEGLWKVVGRLDDVIIHSSGEKTVPGPMEAIIMGNPMVQAVMIFGRERIQTGVLIQLRPQFAIDTRDETKVALTRNQLWPTIEEANGVAPAFSKLYKEMILLTVEGKPLPLAPKGTVMRKFALDVYSQEISALYENIESISTGKGSNPLSWDTNDLERWILEETRELTAGKCSSTIVNLFDQGFDSLSATILRIRIKNALRSSTKPLLMEAMRNLPQDLIYSTPTIKGLATYLTAYSGPSTGNGLSSGSEAIEDLITKYSKGLESISNPEISLQSMTQPATVVLLTGSTGHLGSHILASLLRDERISKVYAFNRPHSATDRTLFDRQMERFKDIGLDHGLLGDKKLVLVTGDATRSDLGIQKALYQEISSSVHVVIHNAWGVDFNQPIQSYEPNIQSSRHFIDIVRASSRTSPARFVFISSIASAQSWDPSQGPVPEDLLEAKHALGRGYGEGKYVVERILSKSGLQGTALRIGQITGASPLGAWPTTEWFPILVKSSVTLGIFPNLEGVVSWLPADSAAGAVLDIALNPYAGLPRVLNLVHPRPVQFETVLKGLLRAIKEVLGLDLAVVSYDQWLSQIEEHAEKVSQVIGEAIPAIKLAGFFREIRLPSDFSTDKIQALSVKLQSNELQQIGEEDAKQWVSYWDKIGFFRSN